MRGKPLTTVVDELPSWHSKGGGSISAALGHRPQNRAKGADPRTGNLKRETCFCPGVLSSPCPGLPVPGLSWFRVAGSPALPLRVPVCFVPPDVSFHWPRASRSSSQREGRRVKRRGTDPRTGTGRRPKDRLLQVSLYVRLCCLPRRTCVPRRACLALPLPLCYFIFYCVCVSRCQVAGFTRFHSSALCLVRFWTRD